MPLPDHLLPGLRRSRRLTLPAVTLLLAVLLSTVLGAVALAAQTAPPAPAPPESSLSAPAPAPAATFSGAAAQQQVLALAEQIGSRPAGSAAYDQAVAYAADQLRGWGYAPTLQTFPVNTFADRGAQVDVTSSAGGGPTLPARTLAYSAGGIVEAPLVAVGLGRPDEVAAQDLRGKLALIERGTLRFSDKVDNAVAAGAAGVVIFNDAAGDVQGSLVRPATVPAVTISGESGAQLRDLLAQGPVSVRLAVDAGQSDTGGTNVVAELPGARPDAGVVVFGAHLDSVPAGPGANDNGSGSAVVLELARELAQRPLAERPLTVRFVLFGAEELGLYGSRAYVQQLAPAERQAIRANINLDMVGVGDAWRFGGTDELVQLALGAATDLNQRALPLRGPLNSASDHASFIEAGIPAVFLYRTEDPNYHTANDRAEYIDPAALTQAGTIALTILDALAAQS